MTNIIGHFGGEYRFLSNFWPAPVALDGLTYPTVEHAYQAAKTGDSQERYRIQCIPTPGGAKRVGKKLQLRPDWEAVKLSVMEDLLRQKFTRPVLRDCLILTLPHDLVEVNTWGDVFWGVCRGKGDNHLGRLLMKIREEARDEKAALRPA